MWIIKRIDEDDYGCEERMPGTPRRVLITLQNEKGEERTFKYNEEFIDKNNLKEGDVWPFRDIIK